MNRYGLFRFGSLSYAVPLLAMFKIVCQRPGYRLPLLPVDVAEVLVVEGVLVPLLRLSAGHGSDEQSARHVEYKVLVGSEAGTVALPADVSCGIVAENKGELLALEGEPEPGIIGLFQYQENKYRILDIDYLAMALTDPV